MFLGRYYYQIQYNKRFLRNGLKEIGLVGYYHDIVVLVAHLDKCYQWQLPQNHLLLELELVQGWLN